VLITSCSLTLAAMNWAVVATDLADVIAAVLGPNIAANDAARRISIRHLDWTSPVFTADDVYDLIITADTIYEPSLIRPLLDSLHALATRSPRAHLFVCLERRDPPLINSFFAQAHQLGFTADQIPSRKLSKALKKAGMEWSREDWDGVELWKLKLRS
jgi:protein N-lysine methyltransferase METTL21D